MGSGDGFRPQAAPVNCERSVHAGEVSKASHGLSSCRMFLLRFSHSSSMQSFTSELLPSKGARASIVQVTVKCTHAPLMAGRKEGRKEELNGSSFLPAAVAVVCGLRILSHFKP